MWNVITRFRTKQPSPSRYTLYRKVDKYTLRDFFQWYWCCRTPIPTHRTAIQQFICSSSRITVVVCFEKHLLFDNFQLIKKKVTLRAHVLKPLPAFVIWLFKTNNINSVKTSTTNKNTFANRLQWNNFHGCRPQETYFWTWSWRNREAVYPPMISLVAPVSLLHPHSRYEVTDHRIDAVSSCDGDAAYAQGPWLQGNVKLRSLQLLWGCLHM